MLSEPDKRKRQRLLRSCQWWVRGQLDEEIATLKDTARRAQQRERELLAEMESKDEQARGLRMQISSLEDKLVKVSTSNVELNSRLLDQQREASHEEEKHDAEAALADVLKGLDEGSSEHADAKPSDFLRAEPTCIGQFFVVYADIGAGCCGPITQHK